MSKTEKKVSLREREEREREGGMDRDESEDEYEQMEEARLRDIEEKVPYCKTLDSSVEDAVICEDPCACWTQSAKSLINSKIAMGLELFHCGTLLMTVMFSELIKRCEIL